MDPYPEDPKEKRAYNNETPPSIKHITENTNYENFYRWGIQGGKTGNHRILYAIHNYCKVIMLFYFNKQYNGSIKREDIVPAESNYQMYCLKDPLFLLKKQ